MNPLLGSSEWFLLTPQERLKLKQPEAIRRAQEYRDCGDDPIRDLENLLGGLGMENESNTLEFAQMLGRFRTELLAEGFDNEASTEMVLIFWNAISQTFHTEEDNWDALFPGEDIDQ